MMKKRILSIVLMICSFAYFLFLLRIIIFKNGFNSYDYMAQRIVGPDLEEYFEDFIPEFLNLEIITDVNGTKHPNITVDILQ